MLVLYCKDKILYAVVVLLLFVVGLELTRFDILPILFGVRMLALQLFLEEVSPLVLADFFGFFGEVGEVVVVAVHDGTDIIDHL